MLKKIFADSVFSRLPCDTENQTFLTDLNLPIQVELTYTTYLIPRPAE